MDSVWIDNTSVPHMMHVKKTAYKLASADELQVPDHLRYAFKGPIVRALYGKDKLTARDKKLITCTLRSDPNYFDKLRERIEAGDAYAVFTIVHIRTLHKRGSHRKLADVRVTG